MTDFFHLTKEQMATVDRHVERLMDLLDAAKKELSPADFDELLRTGRTLLAHKLYIYEEDEA